MISKIRAVLAQATTSAARDLKYGPVYEKAVGSALGIGILAALFAETSPVLCVIAGIFAGAFGMSCYFLRHYK